MTSRRIVVALVVAWIGIAQAADPEAGRQKSAVCEGCHGADGNSIAPLFPKLAGQHSGYLAKQLKDFRSGSRTDPTMTAFAAPLSDDDIADLAAYFSQQALAAGSSEAGADTLTRGKRLYMGGDDYSGVPACASCHGPAGSGNPAANYPLLKAQYAAYVLKQLKDFKAGDRSNDPNKMMRDIAARLTDADINALAEYIATLPPG